MQRKKEGEKIVGRPWFDGQNEEIVVAKLEQAFAIDASVEEACSFASISRDSYYRYIDKHPELRNRFDDLRQQPILKARTTVVEKLSDSYQNSMDYLKRKRKKEFGENIDITTEGEKITGVEIKIRK